MEMNQLWKQFKPDQTGLLKACKKTLPKGNLRDSTVFFMLQQSYIKLLEQLEEGLKVKNVAMCMKSRNFLTSYVGRLQQSY